MHPLDAADRMEWSSVVDSVANRSCYKHLHDATKYTITCFTGETLQQQHAALFQSVWLLFCDNMRSLYETHIGWKPRRKKQELSDEQHHYVLVTRTTDQELMAFLAFRFTQEDDYEPLESCVYVYELQVDASFRRLKLGSFLMDVAEGIAQHQQCSRVLLTSFLDNAEANAFYARLGYTMDETSPQKVLSKEDAADFSYAILSKRISPPKVNT